MIICRLTFSATPGGGSVRGGEPGRRGRVCKAHNDTWCRRACVRDGAVFFGPTPDMLLRCQHCLFFFYFGPYEGDGGNNR